MDTDSLLYAHEMKPTYENFEARCPVCGFWNIFNRRSDLNDMDLICFKRVNCLSPSCKISFNINCDHANPAWQMFLMGVDDFLEKKQYMLSVVIICQALEVFYAYYLFEILFCRVFRNPERTETDETDEEVNSLLSGLNNAIESCPLWQLRELFIYVVALNMEPSSFTEAKDRINDLKKCLDKLKKTKDKIDLNQVLREHSDDELKSLLLEFRGISAPDLRNKIVHKYAYRPHRDEVMLAREEVELLTSKIHVRLQARSQR